MWHILFLFWGFALQFWSLKISHMARSCTRSLVTVVAGKALSLLVISVGTEQFSWNTTSLSFVLQLIPANCAGAASLTSSLPSRKLWYIVDFDCCCVSDFSLRFCLQEDYFNINLSCWASNQSQPVFLLVKGNAGVTQRISLAARLLTHFHACHQKRACSRLNWNFRRRLVFEYTSDPSGCAQAACREICLLGQLLLSVAGLFFMWKILNYFWFFILGTRKLGYRCNNLLYSFSLGPYWDPLTCDLVCCLHCMLQLVSHILLQIQPVVKQQSCARVL